MSKKTLTIQIETQNMSSQQVRLIKSINLMLKHVLTTKHENEYFDHSSDLLRFVATAIKQANFSQVDTEIDYGQQALEFCVDTLSDQIYAENVIQYDN